MLGSLDNLNFVVNIQNKGEPAHLCTLRIALPTYARLTICPGNCECKDSTVICSVANPLGKNEKVIF